MTGAPRDNAELGLHWGLTNAINGALFTIRRELGPWFPERVYSNATAVALRECGIECRREVPYGVVYHGVPVGLFRADLVVDNRVLVEVKVADRIVPAHREQAWHYLAASGLEVALILNFGAQASTARIEMP
jgi:GxxExxY protein